MRNIKNSSIMKITNLIVVGFQVVCGMARMILWLLAIPIPQL